MLRNLTSRQRSVLALSCLAQFMVILDVSIVNVALPSIERDLHYSQTSLGWVVSAYAIFFSGFLLLGGRVADVLGGRSAYGLGMVFFVGASVAAGLATSAAMLNLARAMQGIGGAMLAPVSLSLIVTSFPEGTQRHAALGLWTSMASVGGALGGVLGGILTDVASWRWIFLINIPFGIIGLFVLSFMPRTQRARAESPRLDWFGSVTVTTGLALFVGAILGAEERGWTSLVTIGTFGISMVTIALFVLSQASFVRDPLLPLRLLGVRTITATLAVMLIIGGAFFGMWYFLSLYIQGELGFSPLRTGFAFVPMSVASVAGSMVSARLIQAWGARNVFLSGAGVGALGFLGLSLVRFADGYFLTILGPSVILAFGLGLSMTPLATMVSEGVSARDAGIVSGLLNCSRQIGGAIGLAALIAVGAQHGSSGFALIFLLSALACIISAVLALVLIPSKRGSRPS